MFVLSSTAKSKEAVRACVFRAADHIGKKELARKTFRNIAKRWKYPKDLQDGSPYLPLHFLSPVTVPKYPTEGVLRYKQEVSLPSFSQSRRFTFVDSKYRKLLRFSCKNFRNLHTYSICVWSIVSSQAWQVSLKSLLFSRSREGGDFFLSLFLKRLRLLITYYSQLDRCIISRIMEGAIIVVILRDGCKESGKDPMAVTHWLRNLGKKNPRNSNIKGDWNPRLPAPPAVAPARSIMMPIPMMVRLSFSESLLAWMIPRDARHFIFRKNAPAHIPWSHAEE